MLFVKLRQYPGRDRDQVAIDTNALSWEPGDADGLEIKSLYAQPGFADTTRLERFAPGADPGRREYPDGVEIFVLSGEFSDERGRYAAGSWLRLPVGAAPHNPP